MESDDRNEYMTRDSLLKLLSDDEVARVSTAEAASTLADGDDYVDLEQLDRGVQRATGTTAPTGGLLPRKAAREATWRAIVARLPVGSAPTAHSLK